VTTDFRWSDNIMIVEPFSASRSNFVDRASDALLNARLRACRVTHHGGYRAQHQYCPALELQVGCKDGRYQMLGRLIDTELGPKSAFHPERFYAPALQKWLTRPRRGDWPGSDRLPWPAPEPPLRDDAEYIRENVDAVWMLVEDTLAWGDALRGIATGMSDEL
jgi:hypothetical protein